MFVGVGASRVRDLFENAKKNAPAIVFIDEIDAVGRRRGAGLGGGHDEREQTLNQLLVEMDGFGINEGVIIVAATNRADILDPALLRPGRFDRRVNVSLPDVRGREEILNVHAKGKKFAAEVEFKTISQTTPGFSGAELENLLNEAAILTARDDKPEITMEEMRKAYIKVGFGTERRSRVISPRERKVTAYHEAGHAIMQEVLEHLDHVHIISIIPTGAAGGYTSWIPAESSDYKTKSYFEQQIISCMGGRAAEQIVVGDISTGASGDIHQATSMARNMVTRYGMSEKIGPIQYGDSSQEVFIGRDMAQPRNYSEDIAKTIDEEIKRIIKTAYDESIRILNENMDVLHSTAELLLEKEKITGADFRKLFNITLPKKVNVPNEATAKELGLEPDDTGVDIAPEMAP
jgi:cell division protease FtsH